MKETDRLLKKRRLMHNRFDAHDYEGKGDDERRRRRRRRWWVRIGSEGKGCKEASF